MALFPRSAYARFLVFSARTGLTGKVRNGSIPTVGWPIQPGTKGQILTTSFGEIQTQIVFSSATS